MAGAQPNAELERHAWSGVGMSPTHYRRFRGGGEEREGWRGNHNEASVRLLSKTGKEEGEGGKGE